MLIPSSERQQYFDKEIVDYSVPFDQNKLTIFLRSAKQFHSNVFSFFGLIEWKFWLNVYVWLLLMLLVVIMVYITFAPKYKLNMKTVINFLIKIFSKKLIEGLMTMF